MVARHPRWSAEPDTPGQAIPQALVRPLHRPWELVRGKTRRINAKELSKDSLPRGRSRHCEVRPHQDPYRVKELAVG
eukprot:6513029-Alexandrium_andersonii.AAC.1